MKMSNIYQPAEDSYLLSKIIRKEVIKQNVNLTILEVGCGSGIQLQTIADAGIKKQNIFSCDINPKAVEHCKKLGFNCIQSDLFENIKDIRLSPKAIKKSRPSEIRRKSARKIKEVSRYGMIIFNPPYLPEEKDEPKKSRIATTGGKIGGEIINRFLIEVKNYLKQGGVIILLTSNLTKGINWLDFNKKLLGKKKLFFEELSVWELTI